MKAFLISSGELLFAGDYENLLHRIDRADGVLGHGQTFRCTLYHPQNLPVLHTKRTPLSFVFHCRYAPCDEGFRISYKVRPGLRTAILCIVSFILTIYSLISIPQGLNAALFTGPALSLILLTCSLWARKKCIVHFRQFFSAES